MLACLLACCAYFLQVSKGPGGGGAAGLDPLRKNLGAAASGSGDDAAAAGAGAQTGGVEETPAQKKRAREKRRKERRAREKAIEAGAVGDSSDSSVAAAGPGGGRIQGGVLQGRVKPDSEAELDEADLGPNIPYFPGGNPRTERFYREADSLFLFAREPEWKTLFGESVWKKIGLGAQRELETDYLVEGRLRDIEVAIGHGLAADELLPVLRATRQFLLERLDGCLDVLEADGNSHRVKLARVMQDMVRDKRSTRVHRSSAHQELWARAGVQLERTTDKKFATMLHFERFGESPWSQHGASQQQGRGGGGQPGRQGGAQNASKADEARWSKGRAAYEKDKKAGASWIGRKKASGGKAAEEP